MSEPVFGRCRDGRGRTSYEALAETADGVEPLSLAVDLACGSGPLCAVLARRRPGLRLIGVDMSEDELELARKAGLGPGAEFRLGPAERLDLADGSVDAVLCHMALMLMVPPDPALREAARILRPGGLFAAAVFDRPAARGLYAAVVAAALEAVRKELPDTPLPPPSDPRLFSDEGQAALFQGADFRGPLRAERAFFSCRLSAEGAWEMMKNMYLICLLPEGPKAAVRERIIETARGFCADGAGEFELPALIFTARR